MENDVRKTRRRLPHWQLEGSCYFLTFRVRIGELTMAERLLVLDHLKYGHQRFYFLFAAVVMPDHAHVLLRPLANIDLSRITKGMKGVSARLINQSRNTTGTIWQDESFDRIVRDDAEFREKLQYMVENPAKRNLVPDAWDYAGLFVNDDLDG